MTVDIEKYRLDRPERTMENRAFNLLFVGRVVKLKGLELLLPIIKTLSGNVRLIIAGDGPELPAVRQLASELGITERIEFKGYVEGEALRNCYRQADAFILPTKNDCYGLVILEAMCAGLPVISSKYADGAPDLIEEGVTGFIVDPYDPVQLKDAVTALINDPQKAETMGRSGRERSEQFSFEKVSKGFREAVQSVCCFMQE